ncbi:hypothetical protein KQI36_00665 [Clostridium senegalense]|uniref:hypothetical protein n=1 Tax=Clostridium senegalense TaxID=1465809 RepID=UPI001C0FF5F4|nr:hypothetical protein [Clostridium senegalense]MBU5225174.1 hypothetical protein [Clostridium senegalense]
MPIVTPIYLNPPYLVSIFKATVIALANTEFFINKKEFSIKSTLPLSELTCGRITQGNGTIEYTQAFVTVTIESICQCPTTTFLRLHEMLEENNLIKNLNNLNDLKSLKAGDMIEVTTLLFKDPEVKNLCSIANSLELQMFSNIDCNTVDPTKFLTYLKSTLTDIDTNHCVDYFSQLLFYKYRLVIPLSKDNFSSLSCIENKPVTIFGKVAYIDSILRDTMVDDVIEPIKKFISTNNLTFPYAENFDFPEPTPIYIGIVPLCIHV